MIRLGLIFFVVAGALSADSLRLRDGRTLTGNWLSADGQKIRFVVNDQVQTFAKADVAQVIFGDSSQAGQDTQAAPKNVARVPTASSLQQTQAGIRFQLLKCDRRATEAVVCSFLVETQSQDLTVSPYLSSAYAAETFFVDTNGAQQNAQQGVIGAGNSTLAVTGVPVRGQVTFGGVEPGVERLAVLTMGLRINFRDGIKFVFRGVPLQ